MKMAEAKVGLLERLAKGVVIGDGGFLFALEKRGYVKAGQWTPESSLEHPDAVRQLHREFLRAGSDVMQTFTFNGSDELLEKTLRNTPTRYSGVEINRASCRIARGVADEGGALVAGCLSHSLGYANGRDTHHVQQEFRKQVDVFARNKVDFLICEFFEHVQEMELAIEVCKETGLPVCATMCIKTEGDMHDNSTGACAVRMAQAGADVIGTNCGFGLDTSVATLAKMKQALEAAGVHAYLMSQPTAYHTPDAGVVGYRDLPEFPFALEPRTCTRWEVQTWARSMYELGVRYIGGCCGFEAYHIRAIAEELAPERGFLPKESEKHEAWGGGLRQHTKPWVRARAGKSYWENLKPSTGRPFSASFSPLNQWTPTQGDEEIVDQPGHASIAQQIAHGV